MALDTSNLTTGGQLNAQQAAKRARFNAFRQRVQRAAALQKSLLGVGNPQGDFDVLLQEAVVNGDPALAAAVQQYLATQNPDDAMPVLAALDDQMEFWLALAGKSADEDDDGTTGSRNPNAFAGGKKKKKGWLHPDGRRYYDKPGMDGEDDDNDASQEPDADEDDAQAKGEAAAAGDDADDEGNAREKMDELRRKGKLKGKQFAKQQRTADAATSATAESVEDQMGALKSMRYAIKGLTPSEKRITYGIVYPVNKVDLQGEWAERELVEKAAHNYLRLYRMADTEHSWKDVGGAVVESYIAPQRITQYFGKSLDVPIEEGTWVMAYQWPESEWLAVKRGRISGYSLGGLKRTKSGIAPPDWRG